MTWLFILLQVYHASAASLVNPPALAFHPPALLQVAKGEDITITCSFEGYPKPRVEWYKNNALIPLSQTLSIDPTARVFYDRHRFLNIRDAQLSDQGIYICTGINEDGQVSSNGTYIEIKDPPFFSHQPQNLTLVEGSSGIIPCSASGLPEPTSEWFRNSNPVPVSNSAVLQDRVSGRLQFVGVRPEHGGPYVCQASNKWGSALSEPVYLTVLTIGRIFRQNPRNLTVLTGRPIQLFCDPPYGDPPPTVSWYKNNVKLDASALSPGELYIPSSNLDHSGWYWCEASNMAGTARSPHAFVEVQAAPKIRGPMIASTNPFEGPFITNMGDSIQLWCNTTGYPPPQVTWSRLDSEHRGPLQVSTESGNTLHIQKISATDAGAYSCEAKNFLGFDKASIVIEVYSPPIFRIQPMSVSTTVGSRVTLECQGHGRPQPMLSWQRHGSTWSLLRNQDVMLGHVRVDDSGTLIIEDATSSDEGLYTCKLSNEVGTAGKEVQLRVLDPSAAGQLSVNTFPSGQVEGVEGESLEIECVSEPSSASLSWSFADTGTAAECGRCSTTSSSAGHLVLRISPLMEADNRVVRCVSEKNGLVMLRTVSILVLRDSRKPPQPTAVVGKWVGTNLTVRWNHVGYLGAPTLSFEVSTNKTEFPRKPQDWIVLATSTAPEVILSSVNPYASFQLHVVAVNKNGASNPSEAMVIQGMQTRERLLEIEQMKQLLDYQPKITVVASNSSSFIVRIENKTDTPLYTGALVMWMRSVDLPRNVWSKLMVEDVSQHDRGIIIGQLPPNMEHIVRVQLVNSEGASLLSPLVSVRTLEGAIQKMSVFVAPPSGVTVSWSLTEWANPLVLGYRVVCRNTDSGDKQEVTVSNRLATTVDFKNLVPGVRYTVVLTVVMSNGESLSTPEHFFVAGVESEAARASSFWDMILVYLRKPWVAASLGGVVLLLLIIIFLCCCCWKRHTRTKDRRPPHLENARSHLLVPVEPDDGWTFPPSYRVDAERGIYSGMQPMSGGNGYPSVYGTHTDNGDFDRDTMKSHTFSASGIRNTPSPVEYGGPAFGHRNYAPPMNSLSRVQLQTQSGMGTLNLERGPIRSTGRHLGTLNSNISDEASIRGGLGTFDSQPSPTVRQRDGQTSDNVSLASSQLGDIAMGRGMLNATPRQAPRCNPPIAVESNPKTIEDPSLRGWMNSIEYDQRSDSIRIPSSIRSKNSYRPPPKLELLGMMEFVPPTSSALSNISYRPDTPETVSAITSSGGVKPMSLPSPVPLPQSRYGFASRPPTTPSVISSRRLSQSSSMLSSELYQSEMDPSAQSDVASERRRGRYRNIPPPVNVDELTSDLLVQWAESVTNSSPSSSGGSSPSRMSAVSDNSMLTDEDFNHAAAEVARCDGFDLEYTKRLLLAIKSPMENDYGTELACDYGTKLAWVPTDTRRAPGTHGLVDRGRPSPMLETTRGQPDSGAPAQLSFSNYLSGYKPRHGNLGPGAGPLDSGAPASSFPGDQAEGLNTDTPGSTTTGAGVSGGTGPADGTVSPPLTLNNLRQHEDSLERMRHNPSRSGYGQAEGHASDGRSSAFGVEDTRRKYTVHPAEPHSSTSTASTVRTAASETLLS